MVDPNLTTAERTGRIDTWKLLCMHHEKASQIAANTWEGCKTQEKAMLSSIMFERLGEDTASKGIAFHKRNVELHDQAAICSNPSLLVLNLKIVDLLEYQEY
jgi:hypothetical protein